MRQAGLPYVENLNSSSSTRAVVGALARLFAYLADPKSAAKLAEVYRVWRRDERDDPAAVAEIKEISEALKRIKQVEDLVAPRLSDWLDDAITQAGGDERYDGLRHFRERVGAWLRAAEMPIDQLL